MNMTLSDVEFETRTIGPLVLTTPCLRRLGLREIINRLCPVAEQADFDHGLVAELVTTSGGNAPHSGSGSWLPQVEMASKRCQAAPAVP